LQTTFSTFIRLVAWIALGENTDVFRPSSGSGSFTRDHPWEFIHRTVSREVLKRQSGSDALNRSTMVKRHQVPLSLRRAFQGGNPFRLQLPMAVRIKITDEPHTYRDDSMHSRGRHLLATALQKILRSYPLSRGAGRIAQSSFVRRLMDSLPKEVETSTKSGVPVFVDPSDYLGSMIYLFGVHEPANLALLQRLVPHDGVFWDIGANYGLFSLELCASQRARRVVAVEPQPALVRLMRQSLEKNPASAIWVVEKAVASGSKNMPLAVPKGSFARASLVEQFHDADIIQVATLPLSSLLDIYGPPDVVKIDVEGAELDVLESGAAVLREHSPTILFEVNAARNTPLGSISSVRFLADYGYQFYPVSTFPHSICRLDSPLETGHDVVALRTE